MCYLRSHLAAGGAQMDTLSTGFARTFLECGQVAKKQREVAINRLIFALRYAQPIVQEAGTSETI